jgi:hypothetical protein
MDEMVRLLGCGVVSEGGCQGVGIELSSVDDTGDMIPPFCISDVVVLVMGVGE